MRTLISTAFVSLDGVVEAPGGEPGYRNSGWTFKDVEFLPESFEIKGREQQEAAAMMMGRVSYEAFSPVWPGMEEFAQYKAMPKYVVSTTLTEDELVADWGETTILRSLDEVAALKETEGGPIIIHGSAASTGASPTPASSTATTCSSSRCCSARASACSATRTRTPRSSRSSSPRRTPTVCRSRCSTSSADGGGTHGTPTPIEGLPPRPRQTRASD